MFFLERKPKMPSRGGLGISWLVRDLGAALVAMRVSAARRRDRGTFRGSKADVVNPGHWASQIIRSNPHAEASDQPRLELST
jgi:hypothetical protein